MILADVAEQSTGFSLSQAFFYLAIAVAVGYFGWQFYKGTKEGGNAAPRRDDASSPAAVESTASDITAPDTAAGTDTAEMPDAAATDATATDASDEDKPRG